MNEKAITDQLDRLNGTRFHHLARLALQIYREEALRIARLDCGQVEKYELLDDCKERLAYALSSITPEEVEKARLNFTKKG